MESLFIDPLIFTMAPDTLAAFWAQADAATRAEVLRQYPSKAAQLGWTAGTATPASTPAVVSDPAAVMTDPYDTTYQAPANGLSVVTDIGNLANYGQLEPQLVTQAGVAVPMTMRGVALAAQAAGITPARLANLLKQVVKRDRKGRLTLNKKAFDRIWSRMTRGF